MSIIRGEKKDTKMSQSDCGLEKDTKKEIKAIRRKPLLEKTITLANNTGGGKPWNSDIGGNLVDCSIAKIIYSDLLYCGEHNLPYPPPASPGRRINLSRNYVLYFSKMWRA